MPEGSAALGTVTVTKSPDGIFTLKTRRLNETETQQFLQQLDSEVDPFTLVQTREVTPVFAKSFRNSAIKAIVAASIMIILYIRFAFRRVSQGISPWKLGVAAIIALLHDLLIMMGIFAVLGEFFAAEIDILFITAMLSIMGFSVHNTIVVFDRIRENILHKDYQETFDHVAERSVQQTLGRSINTSLTACLVLLPILFVGVHEIFYFLLALLIGVIFGTYTSVFIATALLTTFQGSSSPAIHR